MQISEENKYFYSEHKDDIDKIVARENQKRTSSGKAALSSDEINSAFPAMQSLVDAGSRVRQFTFPESFETGKTEETRNTGFAQQHTKKIQKINGDVFNFRIVKVLNGYVLNCEHDSEEKPYIFKTRDELVEILELTVLKHFEAKGDANGRKNKKVRGRVETNKSGSERRNSNDGGGGAGFKGNGQSVVEHAGIAVCSEGRTDRGDGDFSDKAEP